jgi:hypothetical protein
MRHCVSSSGYRIERQIRSLSDEQRLQQRQAHAIPILQEFKVWLDIQANAVLPKSALGNAVQYTLKNWEALCRYTEAGYLEPDNNYAEQCLRPVAVGRKAFLFVGSERAGRAAAIYYSLVESCKANKVNPLTYLTYVLSNVRNKQVTLLTPDEYRVPTSPTPADVLFNNLVYAERRYSDGYHLTKDKVDKK